MTKPPVSNEQKDAFVKEFNAIISKAGDDIRQAWAGNIYWVGDIPSFEGNIHLKLKGKLLDEFVKLKNKLASRSL